MQQFIFTIEYVKLNLPFRQFLTLITMEEIIYRNYFTHSHKEFVKQKPTEFVKQKLHNNLTRPDKQSCLSSVMQMRYNEASSS